MVGGSGHWSGFREFTPAIGQLNPNAFTLGGQTYVVRGLSYNANSNRLFFSPYIGIASASLGPGDFRLQLGDRSFEFDGAQYGVGTYSFENANISWSSGDTVAVSLSQLHPTLSIDSPAVLEGGPGDTNRLTWTVSLSAASTQTVSVRHFLATGGTANLRSDYTGLTSSERTLTFQPGETSKTFFATIVGDDVEEADETIRVGLLSPTNAVFPGGGTSLIYTLGTIVNDDPLRTLTVDSPAVPEGSDDSARNRLTFTVSLSRAIGLPVTVQYAGTNDGTARLHGASNPATDPAPAEFDVLCDWCGNVTTLTIPAGQTTATIEAYIVGDTDDEEHETLVVSFFSPSNAVFPGDAGRVDATGTILDDDGPLPVLSVNSPSVHEGGAGARNTLNFVVTLRACESFAGWENVG